MYLGYLNPLTTEEMDRMAEKIDPELLLKDVLAVPERVERAPVQVWECGQFRIVARRARENNTDYFRRMEIEYWQISHGGKRGLKDWKKTDFILEQLVPNTMGVKHWAIVKAPPEEADAWQLVRDIINEIGMQSGNSPEVWYEDLERKMVETGPFR